MADVPGVEQTPSTTPRQKKPPTPTQTLTAQYNSANAQGLTSSSYLGAINLSQRTGLPISVARALPEEAKKAQTLEDLRAFADTHPMLTKFFGQSPGHAVALSEYEASALKSFEDIARLAEMETLSPDSVIAKDVALEGLESTEQRRTDALKNPTEGVIDSISESLERTLELTIGTGYAGAALLNGEQVDEAKAYIKWANDKWENFEEPDDPLDFIFASTTEFAVQMAYGGKEALPFIGIGAGAGFLTGGPAGALTGTGIGLAGGFARFSFWLEAGHAFLELSEIKDIDGNKLDEQSVRWASYGVGLLNAGLETMSAGAIARMFPGARELTSRQITRLLRKEMTKNKKLFDMFMQFGRESLEGGAFELGGEVTQELTPTGASEFLQFLDPEFGEEDVSEKTPLGDRTLAVIQKTLSGFGGMHVTATTVNVPLMVRDARKNEIKRDKLKKVTEAAEKSGAKEKSPTFFKFFLQSVGVDEVLQLHGDDLLVLSEEVEGMPEALEAIGYDREMVKEAARYGYSHTVSASEVVAAMDREKADLLIDADSTPGSRTTDANDTTETLIEGIDERLAVVEEVVGDENAYQVQLQRLRKDLIAAAKESKNLSGQILGKGLTFEEFADTNIEIIDAVARRLAVEGLSFDETLKRIFIEPGTRAESEAAFKAATSGERTAVENLEQVELAEGQDFIAVEGSGVESFGDGTVRLIPLPERIPSLTKEAADTQRAEIARVEKMRENGRRILADLQLKKNEIEGVPGATQTQLQADDASDQINTPAFKKFFRGSKITDPKGNPRLVFHVAREGFTEFSREKSPEGFFFSNKPRTGDFGGAGGRTIPAFVRIKNPYFGAPGDIEDVVLLMGESDARLALEEVDFREETVDETIREVGADSAVDAISDYMNETNNISSGIPPYQNSVIVKFIESAGFDGVIGSDSFGGTEEIVAFKSSQIKSAIANKGTFDPASPNILLQADAPKPAALGSFFAGLDALSHVLGDRVLSVFGVESNEKIHQARVDAGDLNRINARVQDIDNNKLEATDIFHASPVCKSFSRANQVGGLCRLDLVTAQATADHILARRPPVVVIENVEEFTTKDTRAVDIIRDALREVGYTFDEGVYQDSDFGGHTRRRRWFLRAVRFGELPPKPTGTKRDTVNWFDEIEDLVEGMEDTALSGTNLKHMAESGIDPTNIDTPLLAMGGFKSMAFNGKPAPTVVASPKQVHRLVLPDGRVKRMTPRALARLMGFDDTLILPDDQTLGQTMVGNSIPASLVEAIHAPLLPLAQREDITLLQTEHLDESVLGKPGGPIGARFDERAPAYEALPRGAFRIVTQGYLIKMFENANLTTLSHEAAHVFLEEMRMLVDSGKSSEQFRKDWNVIRKFLGREDQHDGNTITKAEHELFARSWEAYILEGKAPSIQLSGAFQRLSEWLLAVYTDGLAGLERSAGFDINLNDEVRGVFDRMLASREEVAQAVMENKQYFISEAEAQLLDMTQQELDEINALIDLAIREGKSALLLEREGQLPALRKQWTIEAEAKASATPIYQAIQFLLENGGMLYGKVTERDSIPELRKKVTAEAEKVADREIGKAESKPIPQLRKELKAEAESRIRHEKSMYSAQVTDVKKFVEMGVSREKAKRLKIKTNRKARIDEIVNSRLARVKTDRSTDSELVTEMRRHGKDIVASKIEPGVSIPGQDINQVALSFGFNDGHDMMLNISDAPTRKDFIKAILEQRTTEFMKSIPADEVIIDTVGFQRAMDRLADFVRRRTDSVMNETEANYRFLADKQMQNMPMEIRNEKGTLVGGVMNTRTFINEFKRNMTVFRKLLSKGLKGKERSLEERAKILSKALQAHRKAMIARQKIKASREQKKKLERMRRDSTRDIKNSRANKKSRLQEGYLLNLMKVLDRFSIFGPKKKYKDNPDSGRPPIATLAGVTDPTRQGGSMFSPELVDDNFEKPYGEMTLEEFRELANMVQFLSLIGKKAFKDQVAQGAIRRTALKKLILNAIRPVKDLIGLDADDPGTSKLVKANAAMFQAYREFEATQQILFHGIRMIDGFTNLGPEGVKGPAETFLYDQLELSLLLHETLLADITHRMTPHWQQLDDSSRKHPVRIDVGVDYIDNKAGKKVKGWTFDQIIMVALNMGNPYQLDALARGYGWGKWKTKPDPGRPGKTIDYFEVNTRIFSKITSVLTTKDWRAIEGVWIGLDSLWPQASSTYKRVNGQTSTKVEAVPFNVTPSDTEGKSITVRGGYAPIYMDRSAMTDKNREAQEAMDTVHERQFVANPNVKTYDGMFKDRKGSGGRPIRLDVGVIAEHISTVIRYIAYTEVLQDFQSVLGEVSPLQTDETGKLNEETKETVGTMIKRKFGKEFYDQILLSVQETANPKRLHWDKIERIINTGRSMSSKFTLGLNFEVGVKQPFSFSAAFRELSWASTAHGVFKYARNPWGAWTKMREKSINMRRRGDKVDIDTQIRAKEYFATNDFDRMVNALSRKIPALVRPSRRILEHFVWMFISLFDSIAVTPAWWGAYHHALKRATKEDRLITEEELVLEADKLIAFTQPSGRAPFDFSTFQRDRKGINALFNMFTGFTMKYGNGNKLYRLAALKGPEGTKGFRKFLRQFIIDRIGAPLAMMMFIDMMRGDVPFEDEDDWIKYGSALAAYQFIGVPFLREFMTGAVYWMSDEGYPSTVSDTPAFRGFDILTSATKATIKSARKGEITDAHMRMWSDLLGFLSGVPLPQFYRKLIEGYRQMTDERRGKVTNLLFPNPELRE